VRWVYSEKTLYTVQATTSHKTEMMKNQGWSLRKRLNGFGDITYQQIDLVWYH